MEYLIQIRLRDPEGHDCLPYEAGNGHKQQARPHNTVFPPIVKSVVCDSSRECKKSNDRTLGKVPDEVVGDLRNGHCHANVSQGMTVVSGCG